MTEKSFSDVRQILIKTALGEIKPDLILRGGKIINVFSEKITEGDILIKGGYIAAVGDYSQQYPKPDGFEIAELCGKYVSPGFINAHVHVESSMVLPNVYTKEELRFGVSTIITDPHEIGNVGGMPALRSILKLAENIPINYYVMLPSCVPSTPFEHSGAVLTAEELAELRDNPHVLGLGEMMNVPGVLKLSEDVMAKLDAFGDKIIDGHSPLLSGRDLSAYAAAGIMTDHEASSFEEALEKLENGIAVLVREGSAAKNLEDIISGAVRSSISTENMAFCTDDKHLSDVCREGTIRCCVKKAIALGLNPISAYKMASINAAKIYGLRHIGAVAPSYKADLLIIDDIESVSISEVYKDGVPFERLSFEQDLNCPKSLLDSVNYAPLSTSALELPESESYSAIGITKGQIITRKLEYSRSDALKDLESGELLKIAVIERHHATGNIGVGLIKGYGLKGGAVATSVAHDSHNIIVVGDNDGDMLLAAEELKRIKGGYVVVKDGKPIGALPLVFGGLMSLLPAEEFTEQLDKTIAAAKSLGVSEGIDPFITLSFMALPVIPEIRITDMGIIEC